MRALILLTATALLLSGCNRGSSSSDQTDSGSSATNEVVSTNDITAIDAATGEAANMAPDVDYMPNDMAAAADSNAQQNQTAAPRARRPATKPAATSSAANSTATEPATTPSGDNAL